MKEGPICFSNSFNRAVLNDFLRSVYVEVFYDAPEPIIRKTSFGNQAVNVGVPFQGPPKRVKNADKSRDKVFRLLDVMEQAQDNAANSPEEAIK